MRPHGPRTSRLVTALRFLLRSLSLRGSSFLLALLAILVGATVTATMLNIHADLSAKMATELRRFGPNLLVTPIRGPGPGDAPATMDEAGALDLPARLESSRIRCAAMSSVLIAAGTVEPAGSAAANPKGPAADEPASHPGVGAEGAAPAASEKARPARTTGSAPPSVPQEPPGDAGSESGRAALSGLADAGSLPTAPARGGTPATVIGADLGALARLHPSWRVSGSWPRAGTGSCLVGAALASRSGLAPGGRACARIASRETILDVAGIVSTGESEEDAVIVDLARLQSLTRLEGRISYVSLSIDGGAEAVSRAGRAIEAASENLSARPLRQVAAAQGAFLAKLRRMMLFLTAIVLTLSWICLGTTLMAMVVERESEIGLMRSIGAGDGQILAMFLGEVGILGLLGSLGGLVLGALGARWIGWSLFGAPIDPRAGVVPVVLGISLALCLASVLVPLRRALAVQPSVALRGV